MAKKSTLHLLNYFPTTSTDYIQYRRGKFLKSSKGDGLISYPGKFSDYGLLTTLKEDGKIIARQYGSTFPSNQKIMIFPTVEELSTPIDILTEAGFQTIEAIDVNGDGVDEIVKVNFNGLEGSKTILKITIYTLSNSPVTPYTAQSFNVKVEGCISDNKKLYSPMRRSYYFGNFKGDGKAQLLTVSHNRTFNDEARTSYFAIINLEDKELLSETTLFDHSAGEGRYVNTIDINGDGKIELCHAEDSQMTSYELKNNVFSTISVTPYVYKSVFNNKIYWADINADGKIDIMVPPAKSYEDIRSRDIPVWAPLRCCFCNSDDPIIDQYGQSCRFCNNNLKNYYKNHPELAVCRDCGDSLSYGSNRDEFDMVTETFLCPNHGGYMTCDIDFGYVDNGSQWEIYTNTGLGFNRTFKNIVNNDDSNAFQFMDVNKDGFSDLVRICSGTAQVFLNNNGVISEVSIDALETEDNMTGFIPANIRNSICLGSLMCVKDEKIFVYDFTRDESKANLLTSIYDSHGIAYTTDYAGMTDCYADMRANDVYIDSDKNYIYPFTSVLFPLNLVSCTKVTVPGLYHPLNEIYYTYRGAVSHMQGLGFCGFEKTKIYDAINNVNSEEIRNPEMQGVTTKVTSPVKEVTYAYSRNKRSNGQENIQVTRSTELDKLTQVSTSTYYQYDSYGNPTCVTQNVGSNLQSITTQSYRNTLSSERFLAGLPLVKTVKRSRTYSVSSDIEGEYAEGSTENPEAEAGAAEESNGSRRRTSMEIIPPVETDSVIDETSVTETWIDREEITYDADSYLPIVKKTYTGADGSKKVGETRWTYDSNGNITSEKSAPFDVTEFLGTTYIYDADGRLTKEASTNGTSVEYTYDSYDRPLTVKETGLNDIWLKKTFTYADGNVASVKYENQRGVIGTEQFTYTNGHNTEITLNGTIPVWKLTAENDLGQPTESVTGSLTRTYGYTEFGMPTQRIAGSIQDFSYDFDVTTGNLNSRTDNTRGLTESFTYDALNRLVGIGDKVIEYADNGNIVSMPGVGSLSYEIADRPYQVSMLTPEGAAVPLRDQSVTYTSFKRPNTIEEDGVKATFTYNAIGDRVKMLVEKNNQILLSRHYIGKQYEYDAKELGGFGQIGTLDSIAPVGPPFIPGREIPAMEEDGIMPFGLDFPTAQGPDYGTHRLYLGGDAYSAPAVYVKNGSTWQLYYICRDYLGSITHIANVDGTLKAEYSYDAWGRMRDPETQEVYESGLEPTLFLGRGYTGHEHLHWFGLINMNARLYDPALGRFLAADPYVQAPDFTQNFNRYSYCLNNPLGYTDKNGEFIFTALLTPIGFTALGVIIDGACWGALFGGASYTAGVALSKGGFDNWNWNGLGRAMISGAVSGALFAGMGLIAPSFVAPSTKFLANLPTYLGKAGYAALTGALSSGSAILTNDLLDNGQIDISFKDYMVGMGIGAGISGILSFAKSLYDFNTWDKYSVDERKMILSAKYSIRIDFDESINSYAEFNSDKGRMFLKMRRECLNSKAFAMNAMEHEMQHVDDLLQNPSIFTGANDIDEAHEIFRKFSEPKAYAKQLRLANKVGFSMNNWIKFAEMAQIFNAPASVYYNFNLFMILRNIF